MPVALEYKSDHLVVRLVGRSLLTAMRRSIVIPYSDIHRVDVESPRWPHALKEWRIGTHVPNVVAHGLFVPWTGGARRFVHFDRRTERVLTIHLDGHPDFTELSLEVRDPEAAQKELQTRAPR